MTFRSLPLLSLVVLGPSLAFGCDGASTEGDAGSDTPSSLDAATLDTPSAFDAPPDASAIDASSAIDAPTDASANPDVPTATMDAGGCDYTALDEVIVECEGAPTFVSRIGVFPTSDACPEFWVVSGRPTHYDSAADAIAGEACDAGCQWHFAMSVTRLYCGRRTGYEVLRADGDGCEDLYRFDDGYYPSVEAYDETHPCP